MCIITCEFDIIKCVVEKTFTEKSMLIETKDSKTSD